MSLKIKMSLDLTEPVKKLLDEFKLKSRMPGGTIINTLISIFCDLPEDIRTDLNEFCKTKIRTLYDQMDQAGKYEFQDLTNKIKKYQDIITFLNHGNTVSIESIVQENRLTTMQIKNGTVIFPSDWIVVNPEQAADSLYCGVVECRNSTRYGIPHFLFFTDVKEARDYTQAEISRINRLCAYASQLFANAEANQVEPVYDPERPGICLNATEYLASPLIGHFAIYEKGDPTYPSDYKPPYGAMIVRNHEK